MTSCDNRNSVSPRIPAGRGKRRIKLPVFFMLTAIILAAGLSVALVPVRAETQSYPVTVINFTPGDAEVKARIYGQPDYEKMHFTPYGNFLKAQGAAEGEGAAFIAFQGVKTGYVTAALRIPVSDVAHFELSVNRDGKTFKQAYVDYCDKLSREKLNQFGPSGDAGVNDHIGTDDLWMGFDVTEKDTVIIAGAFPADYGSVSMEVTAPDAMTIGPNNLYGNKLIVQGRAVNNASYPIYASASIREYSEGDLQGAHLSTNPGDEFGKFRLTSVASSFTSDFGMIPARGTAAVSMEFQTHINLGPLTGDNINVYNYVLNRRIAGIDGAGAIGCVPVRLNNYSYLMAGEGAFAKELCVIEKVTKTRFPSAAYPVESMKPLELRAQPSSASPGMIAIDAWGNGGRYAMEKHGSFLHTGPDDIETGYYYDSLKIKIQGRHLDRITRVVVAPRGNSGGYFKNGATRILDDAEDWLIQDLLKTTLLFYAEGYEDRWQYLNNDSTGQTVRHISSNSITRGNPWNYVRRPLAKAEPVFDEINGWKRQVGESLTVSVNLPDLVPDYFTDGPAATWWRRALHTSSYGGAPDYFDIYVLSGDEDVKPVSVTEWTWNNPNLIRNRTPDFSLPVSHLAKNGSATVNPDEVIAGSADGEDYLAVVPSTIQNGKPMSPKMTVSDAATETQMKYKALSFTGGRIAKDSENGRPVWTITVGKEVKINDYLRAVPDEADKEAVITIREVFGNIEISSENCRLTAGGREVMGDFKCTLDNSLDTFWYSNQLFKVSYAKGEFLGENVWDNQAGQQRLMNGTRWYAEGELNEGVIEKVDKEGDGWIDDPWSMFNGTGIRPEQLKKVKFLPASKDDYAMSFSLGSFLSGGVRGVYPYKNDVGLTMKLETLGFMPDFINEFLRLDDWDKEVEEVRYPYSGNMPEIFLGEEGLNLSVGGDFLFFEAGAAAEFKINTLWEERNVFGVKADVNLFDKLKVGAELFLKEYNGNLLPDRISFGLGSDFIGFMPPAPFLEVEWIRGAVNDMAATAAREGWNYLPPASIELAVGGSIGIPQTDIEFGFKEAALEVGLNKFRIGLYDVQLGPVTISDYLELNVKQDLSKGVEIPGTDGFRLSMPVIEVSGRGQIGISWERYLPKIIDAQGDFSFKFDGAEALRAFFATDLFNESLQSTQQAVASLRQWQSKNGRSAVELAGILKQLGFDYISQSKNAFFAAFGAFSVNAGVSGRIQAPENIPAVGGKSLAEGSVSLSLSGSVLTLKADGSVLNENLKAGFTVSVNLARGLTPKVTYYLGGPGDGSRQQGPFVLRALASDAGGAAAEYPLILEEGAASYAGGAVTFAFGEESEGNYSYEVYLIDRQTSERIFIETGVPMSGENRVVLSAQTAAAMPESRYSAQVVLNKLADFEDGGEKFPCVLDSVTYDGEGNVTFAFSGGAAAVYTYEAYLVSAEGSALIGSGAAANGTNTVTADADILEKLQSGAYRVRVAVYDQAKELAAPIAESGEADYVNPAAAGLAVPVIDGVNYVGNGVYRVGLNDKAANCGYEIMIEGGGGFRLISDYADKELLIGAGLKAGESYSVSVRPYVTAGGNRIFGEWSAEKSFTAQAARPAEVTVQVGSGFKENGGVYYAKRHFSELGDGGILKPAPGAKTQVSFASADCVKYEIIIENQTTGETVYRENDGSGALGYIWSVDLTDAARYEATIKTVTAAGDSNVHTYSFEVDGEAPAFVVNSSSVFFDGENLIFDGYLEEGAAIQTDGFISGGSWTYELSDPDCPHSPSCDDLSACSAAAGKAARAASGNYSGRFEGRARAVVTELFEGDEQWETAAVFAKLYEIIITASDFEGNKTQVRITFTTAADETEGIRQLILGTTSGSSLAVGAKDVFLTAGLLASPSFTAAALPVGELTGVASDNASVITVDASTGKITALAAGTATVTARYQCEDGTELIASLSLQAAQKLPLCVAVASYGKDSLTLRLPALSGFTGTLTISVDGKEYLTVGDGLERGREVTVYGLTGDCAVSITAQGGAYDGAVVYFTADRPLATEEIKPQPAPGDETGRGGGLSGGAIAAIAIGSAAAALLLTLLASFIFRRDKSKGFGAFCCGLPRKICAAVKGLFVREKTVKRLPDDEPVQGGNKTADSGAPDSAAGGKKTEPAEDGGDLPADVSGDKAVSDEPASGNKEK